MMLYAWYFAVTVFVRQRESVKQRDVETRHVRRHHRWIGRVVRVAGENIWREYVDRAFSAGELIR